MKLALFSGLYAAGGNAAFFHGELYFPSQVYCRNGKPVFCLDI